MDTPRIVGYLQQGTPGRWNSGIEVTVLIMGFVQSGVSNHLYSGFDCPGPRGGYPHRASREVWTLSETGYNTFVQCEAEEGHGDSDTAWITLTIGIQWLKISGEIFRCLDMILLSALFLLQAFCCCPFLQDVSVGHGSGWNSVPEDIRRNVSGYDIAFCFVTVAFCCCSVLQDVSVGPGSGCQGLYFWCWHLYWGTLWCPL